MADKPIIFSGPMVRALIDGRKTQTRRLLSQQPEGNWHCDRVPEGFRWVAAAGAPSMPCLVPFAASDRCYVREAWRVHKSFDAVPGSELQALAPRVWPELNRDNCDAHGRYRHARFMPRWASRLTLFVEEVRVHRLQDITEADIRAEGVNVSEPRMMQMFGMGGEERARYRLDLARGAWMQLWDALHTEPGTRWTDNPWIYALTFRVARGNIDQLAA